MNDLPTFEDFRAIIALWPSRAAMGRDLSEPHWTVEAWWRKNSIPPRWIEPVVRAAIKRDFIGVTTDVMLRLHSVRMEEAARARAASKKNTEIDA